MKKFYPQKIYIEEESCTSALAEKIITKCPEADVVKIPDIKHLIEKYKTENAHGVFEKKSLLLCKNRGRFFEACPGTKKDYLCCGYRILHTGSGCPLDCSYCVLQAYLNNPFITLFTNMDDMEAEIGSDPVLNRDRTVRIGTGEYMDSLALEHLTDFVPYFLPFLHKRKGIVLELKTKTADIEHLLELEHKNSLIISWSLNSDYISTEEERGASDIRDRIMAAAKLIKRGYRVSFHFDPVILYNGWEEGYRRTVELLAELVPSSSCVWISIGSLRYMPRLKTVARQRFPKTPIYSQEFIPGIDGKMRYLQDIRINLYSKMVSWLKDYSSDIFIYYCMENPFVWKKTLGFAPSSNYELKKLLDERVE